MDTQDNLQRALTENGHAEIPIPWRPGEGRSAYGTRLAIARGRARLRRAAAAAGLRVETAVGWQHIYATVVR